MSNLPAQIFKLDFKYMLFLMKYIIILLNFNKIIDSVMPCFVTSLLLFPYLL